MSTSKSKEKILQENRFRYHFNRMIYFNKETRKIFSFEAIDDHDEAWLLQKIREANTEHWQFYFNNPPPSDSIKNEVIRELEA
jgi:hypothetical protein